MIIPAPVLTLPTVDEATPIGKALAVADTAEDLVTVPSLKAGRYLAVVNEGPGSAFLAFDATATVTDVEVKKGDSFTTPSNMAIATNVSFIGESGKTPTVRGVLWSGS